MPLSIRTYEPRDEAAVVALWNETFPYGEPRHEPHFVIRLKRDHADDLLVVAHLGDALVGTAMGGYDGHRGWLYTVAVNPTHRRHGIGRALVRHLEGLLHACGAPKINLQVRAGNEQVIPFYEALGYRVEPHTSMGKLPQASD